MPQNSTFSPGAMMSGTVLFFAAFSSGPGLAARMDGLQALFLPEAVIVRTCGGEPAIYDVESFIAPRRQLLSGDALVDFSEWELSGRTEVFGDIAVVKSQFGYHIVQVEERQAAHSQSLGEVQDTIKATLSRQLKPGQIVVDLVELGLDVHDPIELFSRKMNMYS